MAFMSSADPKTTTALPSKDLKAAVGVSGQKTEGPPKLDERSDRFLSVSTALYKAHHPTGSKVEDKQLWLECLST